MRYYVVTLILLCCFVFTQTDDILGDINEDQAVDILDIVAAVTLILSDNTPTDYEMWAADLNFDNAIDILDVIQLVDIVINPLECFGNYFVCPDNPYECCSNSHPQAFMTCANCHLGVYNNTTNPDHSQQGFPSSYCNLCHNYTEGWDSPSWSHIYTDISCINCHLPSTGHFEYMGHSDSSCLSCHDIEGLSETPDCSDCH